MDESSHKTHKMWCCGKRWDATVFLFLAKKTFDTFRLTESCIEMHEVGGYNDGRVGRLLRYFSSFISWRTGFRYTWAISLLEDTSS